MVDKIQYGIGERKEADIEFTMLKPSDSIKVLLYISKIIGGAAGDAITAFSLGDSSALDKIGGGDVDVTKIGQAIPAMLNRIDETETLEKIGIILSSAKISGQPLHNDHFIFDGRPDVLFKILAKALDRNYRFFLQENTDLLSRLVASKDAIVASVKRSGRQA